MTSAYDIDVTTAEGTSVPLRHYAGTLTLVVNVASKCGLTAQYEGLEALHREFADKGLRIVGFPCNQFLGQEPGTDEQIQEFCRLTYDVTFPVLGKIDVNGPEAAPLFAHLRAEAPGDWGPHHGEFYDKISAVTPATEPGDIVWNFTKFLLDDQGEVLARYEPPTTPEDIKKDLQQHL
ncbi:glutathione peroxidase [Saccharopolyspora sp. TS4A08]|uniref:Glutathione peroxidase n=1 Tax=Saccharopolyspora ipomoeae TaxID=3042027 RepID=A0ABT6PIY1_9PSEU|nr:glutathione peroxidase [Saccharopolyspora sp. TS4A08]MDI2027955.1 glutathione peroxidase [Saccharopolyspora sp. TS4A08]